MDTNNVMIAHNENTNDFVADCCKQFNYVFAEKKYMYVKTKKTRMLC